MTGKRVYHIDKENRSILCGGDDDDVRQQYASKAVGTPATNSDIFIPFSMKKTSKSVL